MKISLIRSARFAAVLCGSGGLALALGLAAAPDAAAAVSVAGMPATAAGGTWGTARYVAGALNTGGSAGLLTVSCPSAGDCSAGGSYAHNSASNQQAFVVNETKGTWGTAEEVPGTAALNVGGGAQITSVSCVSAGNCGAAGYYSGGKGKEQAFVVNET
jgi:hypothetical protein